jgi:type IX secretion system PorP/SprF family membrane protein
MNKFNPFRHIYWSKSVRSFFTLLLLFCFSNLTFAQQEPQYTNYMFNTLAYNPAFAGSKDHLSIRALYRDQWYNFGGGLPTSTSDGRPVTQTFSMHGNVFDRVGLGLNIVNDKIGARGTTSVDFSYAYRIKFGEGTLALGVQGGIMNWRANWSELSFRDPRGNDNAFADNDQSLWLPSFGGGIYYNNDNFYLGVSVPKLAGISLRRDSARTDIRRWAQVYQHFYFTIGGIVPLNGKVDFKPSLLIKSVGLFSDFLQKGDQIRNVGAPTSFDINASFLFYDKLWLGVSFRSAIAAFVKQNGTKSSLGSADLLFGYQFSEGMRIGFAYDYPLSDINTYSVGSFEIMLGWDFIKKIDKIEHPRYIF